jgi:NAD(P)-dependent dehydrogenase (short-subunit alcohol dehydrogenase family)
MIESHKPDFALDGRVIMVTGAGRGLGRACALACAAAGADIVAVVRNRELADSLSEEVRGIGRRIWIAAIDLDRPATFEAEVAAVLADVGQIDALLNNVGVSRRDLAEDVTEADFDAVVGTNLKGTFFLTQAVGRAMLARGAGRILNMSSQAGTVTLKGEAIYCMTKAAINHLTRCLAAEWGPRGVAVNSISPTFIWTDSTRPFLSDPANYAATVAHIPLGRIGETREVAGVVVFLASPAASLINGANLLVDGGWSVA